MSPPQPSPGQGARDDEPELSLAQARQVIWQTKPKQPMGPLLDAGLLTRRDLEWARQKAYRPEVRSAARVLLRALDAPPAVEPEEAPPAPPPATEPPRFGPRVITASTYLQERQEDSFGLVMFAVGMGVVALGTTLGNLVRAIFFEPSLIVVGFLLVSIAISAAILTSFIQKQRTAWRNARQGRQGEEQVLEGLREALDHRWTIYRGLRLPGHRADLDLVLVGPGGVWCVQVKAYRAPLRYHDGRWETRRGQGWRPCDPAFDPARVVTGQAVQLHNFLAGAGVERFVEPAIALAEGLPADQVAGSPIPVWLPSTLRRQAAGLSTRHPPADDERAAINAILSRQAEVQRAVEEDRRKGGRA